MGCGHLSGRMPGPPSHPNRLCSTVPINIFPFSQFSGTLTSYCHSIVSGQFVPDFAHLCKIHNACFDLLILGLLSTSELFPYYALGVQMKDYTFANCCLSWPSLSLWIFRKYLLPVSAKGVQKRADRQICSQNMKHYNKSMFNHLNAYGQITTLN